MPTQSRSARRLLWALGAASSLSCGRSSLGLWDAQAGGAPSIQPTGGSRAAGGSSASSVAGAGGVGEVPRDCGALIDDMEDGSGRICTGAGRVGAWYAFNDQTAKSVQWPTPTSPGIPIETSLMPEPRGTSKRAMRSYGSALGWGAGLGFDLDFDGATYRVYDASRYRAVHFWARSSTGNRIVRFRVSTASTTAVKYGGTCQNSPQMECVGPEPVRLQLEPEWLEYTVSFAELARASERDRLTNMQFMAEGDFDFWIDDVSFVEGEPNCCPNLPACQGGVHFADATARRALLGLDDPTAALSCSEVCAVRSANLGDPAIQSLSGFECLSALDKLTIATSSVSDLAPLSGLVGLHELRVDQAKVSDLRPLTGLGSLRVLSMSVNQIADVRALATLTHLRELNLTSNALNDITPLANLTALEKLQLAENQIQDASPVSHLAALRELDLHQNRIDHLGPAFRLPLLPELDLDDNQLTDVTALGSLGALERLYLNRNRVTDASPLARLGQLTRLQLSHNLIETPLGALSGLSRLWELDLSDNQMASLGSVFGLPALLDLDLSDNQLSEVDGLATLSSLSELRLGHNQIADARALAALVQLERLDLSSNSIRTFSGSFAFRRLRFLDLSSNGLVSIPESTLAGSTINTAILAHNQLLDLNAFEHVELVPWTITNSGRNAGGSTDVPLLDVSDNQIQSLASLLRAAWQDATIRATGNPIDCPTEASTISGLRALKNSVDVCP